MGRLIDRSFAVAFSDLWPQVAPVLCVLHVCPHGGPSGERVLQTMTGVLSRPEDQRLHDIISADPASFLHVDDFAHSGKLTHLKAQRTVYVVARMRTLFFH